MSGAVNTPEGEDWYMAHILWQKHGLRMEEYAAMPRHIQLAYIASEEQECEAPVSAPDRLAKAYLTSK